jgi:hypothetical protein
MKTLNTQNYPSLSGFQVVSVDQRNISDLESRIIRAYKQVFNASAWREWVKCATASCKFKTTYEEAPKSCPDCNGEIIDFYSDAEVSQAIAWVMNKSYYQILALMTKGEVAWFSWWWQDSLEIINQQKLGLNIDQFWSLNTWLNIADIDPQWTFYYLSEVWIVPKYRKIWVGATITGMSYDSIKETTQIDASIVRTSTGSPMYPIQEQLWSQVVFSYNDTDDRIILSRKNS